jgi:MFS transporter, DHA1 family, inner membrane transport protein
VSTAGLGLIAAGFGAVELASSSAVALIADRHGARRSVIAGLLLVGAGVAGMAFSGQSRTVAVIGLLVFLAGFEYAFVASLTLVTEAAPEARGRAIGISNSFGTIARAGAVVASGQLYEAFGMTGSLVLAIVTATIALALIISVTDGVRHHL